MIPKKTIQLTRTRAVGTLVCVVLLVISYPSSLIAQQTAANGSLPNHLVQPDTLAIVKLELSAINLPELLKLANQEQKQAQSDMIGMTVSAAFSTLRNAGVDQIYAMVQASLIPQGGICLIIPCEDTESVALFFNGLTPMVPKPFLYKTVQEPGLVIVCPQAFETKLSSAPDEKVYREDLVRSIDSIKNLPHYAVISLSEELHQTLARMLPDNLGADGPVKLSPQALAKHIRSISVGWDLPPKPEIVIKTFSDNQGDAEWTEKEFMRLASMVPGIANSLSIKVEGNQAIAQIDQTKMTTLLRQAFAAQRQASTSMQSANNLKQIGLAMHNYVAANKHFVPTSIKDQNGKPLLSWRVALLPFLGASDLYNKFQLDEAWDSEHNKALIAEIPAVFQTPGVQGNTNGTTRYRLPVMDGTIWSVDEPLTFRQIVDGTSNTIMTIQAPVDAEVVWTKPEPWTLEAEQLKQAIFGSEPTTYAGYADGSVRTIEATHSIKWLKYSLQFADGHVLPDK